MEKIYVINNVRTNNFNDKNIARKIEKSWSEAYIYYGNSKVVKYGVYTNYQSDYTGDYDFYVALDKDLNNLEYLMIPSQVYHIIKVDTTIENPVLNAWLGIWKSDLDRSYLFDYEKYNLDGSIDIYIGLNKKNTI